MFLTYNIGVCELSYNIPMLQSLVNISKSAGSHVTVFTSNDIFGKLDDGFSDDINIVTKNNNVSLSSFLKLVSDYSKHLDLLFVNTVGGSTLDFLFIS